MCVGIFYLHACLCLHAWICLWRPEGDQIPWDWNLRWLWAIIWVLGLEPRSSGAELALFHWISSLAPAGVLFWFLACAYILKCFLYLSLMVSECKVYIVFDPFGIHFSWGWKVWIAFYSTLGYPLFPASFVWRMFLFLPLFHVCFWHLYSRLDGCSFVVYFWVLSCISLICMLVCVPVDLLCSLRWAIVSFQHCSFCLGLLCLIRVCASM